MLPVGTPVRIIEVQQAHALCHARVLEGEHYGKAALLPLKLLAESEELGSVHGPRQWNLVS